jgi:hypothetical protein
MPVGEVDLDAFRALWPAVVDTVRVDNSMLAAALVEARPIAVAGGEALLAFPAGATFSKRMADSEDHRKAVADATRALLGAPLRPRYELREVDESEPALDVAAPPALSDAELVARFVTEFDAEELVDDDEESGA